MTGTIWKIIRFGITGAGGMVIDFGITWMCREKLKWNKYIANSAGFTVAAINNFIFNKIWTFHSTNPDWEPEFGKFMAFSLAGMLLNNLFVYIFHRGLKQNFYLSKLVATLLVFLWNFTTNYYFNFR